MEVTRRESEIQRLGMLLTEMGRELEVLRRRRGDCLRYRVVDRLNGALQRVPLFHLLGKKVLLTGWRVWQRAARQSA